ncbi:hypothetical protein [Streptomyces sp. NPDC002159]
MKPGIRSYILLPEDPVFASKFHILEEPLLHSLHYLYRLEIPSGQAGIVDAAYSSYGKVLRSFPAPLRRLIGSGHAGEDENRSSGGLPYSAFPRFYPVSIPSEELDALGRCSRMLQDARPGDALGEILDELGGPIDLADVFTRVVRMLELKVPAGLVRAFRTAASSGPEEIAILDRASKRELAPHLAEVIRTLSDGDEFEYLAHQALYGNTGWGKR